MGLTRRGITCIVTVIEFFRSLFLMFVPKTKLLSMSTHRFLSTIFALFFAAVTFCTPSDVYADAPKIATVDMQKLFKEYHRTGHSQARFNAEYAKIQKNVNERKQAATKVRLMLRDLAEKINKGEIPDEDLAVKKEEAAMIEMEMNVMLRNIEVFSAKEVKRVATLKAASMQGIMKEIREKVSAHAEKRGFDFVFDQSGKNSNQVTSIVYFRDAQDITAAVLAELNRHAPEEK